MAETVDNRYLRSVEWGDEPVTATFGWPDTSPGQPRSISRTSRSTPQARTPRTREVCAGTRRTVVASLHAPRLGEGTAEQASPVRTL